MANVASSPTSNSAALTEVLLLDGGVEDLCSDEAMLAPRLYGEPLLNLPHDLYIPPDALKVFLEAFEGPLDLLLYLIRKQNFNIFDIPMVQVTAQYLTYVEEVRAHNLELASEYLLMAALLIEIKSRMLLPVVKQGQTDDLIDDDPRAELVRRLLEYEKYKAAALKIDAMPQVGRDTMPAQIHLEVSGEVPLPKVTTIDLSQAWQSILLRAKLNQRHTITQEVLSVRDFMTRILRKLNQSSFVEFADLFSPELGVAVVVVNFIALLELIKEQLVHVAQAVPYAPIYVYINHSSASN